MEPSNKISQKKSSKVAILDAGAQYAKVIDRRIRELCVESVILPLNTPIADLSQYGAIIISGGPESVYSKNAPKFDPDLFTLDVPILGICYGLQLMNAVHGGTVEKKEIREDGVFQIKVDTKSLLFSGLQKKEQVLLTHGDTIDQEAKDFKVIAQSGDLIAGIQHISKPLYGVQFHPEVDLTIHGKDIFKNFLFKIADLTQNYSMENREEKAIAEIREKIGDGHALVLVSGGVDSSVAAVLVTKALGREKVWALHVDHGLMRHKESQKVEKSLKKLGVRLISINAAKEFAQSTTKIDGVTTNRLDKAIQPEEKRKIIGDTFMKIQEQEIAKLNLPIKDVYLVQGTLRPDLIESASTHISGTANVIKTHHNDTQLVRELRAAGRVIEPLSDYHKDEVRQLGKMLGLPKKMVWRHPFPGPGLAIRILCTDKPYITDRFEAINEKLRTFSTDDYKLTLLPIQSVGVQGDGRTYSYAAAISGKCSWKKMFELAKIIPREIHELNRVVYVFGEQIEGPVKTITPTTLQPDVIEQVRQADRIVNEELEASKVMSNISQVSIVSIPVPFSDKPGNRSIVIRTIITNDFMTGVPATPGVEIPKAVLNKIVKKILKEVPGVSRVAYDLTAKPPATTEWE